VLPRLRYRPLHNQTALIIKGALLFERGVVVTSVPIRLHAGERETEHQSHTAAGA